VTEVLLHYPLKTLYHIISYHIISPKSVYNSSDLLAYIESCVEKLSCDFPLAPIALAGDLNQLSDTDITLHTGLTQQVYQPTRGKNILDRLFVSHLDNYSTVRVVGAVGKTDHKAIVAYSEPTACLQRKETFQRTFRRKSPTVNATFLEYILDMDPNSFPPTSDAILGTDDPQLEYDKFYSVALELLNRFYPQRTITVTSLDPEFVTGDIKAKLRRKNKF